MKTNQERSPDGYLYRRGRIWWGRVRLGNKEHRFSLRTQDRDAAAVRLKAVRKKIDRKYFGTNKVAPGYRVYFVHDRSVKALKVGFSRNVKNRLCAIQCGNPNEIVLLGSIEGATQLESVLHRFLSPFHRKGEWFKANPTVLKFVSALIEVDRVRLAAIPAAGTTER
jgi:hypothetical protein